MKRYFLYAFMLTQVLACASMEPIKKLRSPESIADNTKKILAIDNWSLVGRLSVRSAKESWLTSLKWHHNTLVDALTLSTSLGGVVAKLNYSNQVFSLSDSDGHMRETSNAELQSLLGYPPPLRHLTFWVRGVPNPDIAVDDKAMNSRGALVFKQDGWDVKLERFDLFSDLVLPTRVTLIKNGLKIKLVVDEWLT